MVKFARDKMRISLNYQIGSCQNACLVKSQIGTDQYAYYYLA